MFGSFLRRRIQGFSEWWNTPATIRDRVVSGMIGGLGGFWIGLLGRLLLGPQPVDIVVLGGWVVGTMVFLSVLGVLFPKVIGTICYPFSLFGIGNS